MVLDESDILQWEWYLDENNSPFATAKDASIVLTGPTHSITLQVVMANGCTNEVTKTVVLKSPAVCSCPDVPFITLTKQKDTVCVNATYTLTGNTFGGAVTNVTLTKGGGAGTLSVTPSVPLPSTAGQQEPFSIIYVPNSADAGSIVKIAVTTNVPTDPTCGAATDTLYLWVKPATALTFTPTEFCDGNAPPTFPSTGGIAGTWSSNTVADDNGFYTFTPSAGECATGGSWVVTKKPRPDVTLLNPPSVCEGTAITYANYATVTPIGTNLFFYNNSHCTGYQVSGTSPILTGSTYTFSAKAELNGCYSACKSIIVTLLSQPVAVPKTTCE
jgi:hypothetical protein